MYVYHVNAGDHGSQKRALDFLKLGDSKGLWVTMWVLGSKLRFFATVASSLKPLRHLTRCILFYLCVYVCITYV